jgi:hypothetical protein
MSITALLVVSTFYNPHRERDIYFFNLKKEREIMTETEKRGVGEREERD